MSDVLHQLLQWADRHEWGWLVALCLGLLGIVKAVDDWLYKQYSRRITDARDWNDTLEERLKGKREELQDARDDLQQTRDELQKARDELERARETDSNDSQ